MGHSGLACGNLSKVRAHLYEEEDVSDRRL